MPQNTWFNKHLRKRGQNSAVPNRSPNLCHSPGNDYQESSEEADERDSKSTVLVLYLRKKEKEGENETWTKHNPVI